MLGAMATVLLPVPGPRPPTFCLLRQCPWPWGHCPLGDCRQVSGAPSGADPTPGERCLPGPSLSPFQRGKTRCPGEARTAGLLPRPGAALGPAGLPPPPTTVPGAMSPGAQSLPASAPRPRWTSGLLSPCPGLPPLLPFPHGLSPEAPPPAHPPLWPQAPPPLGLLPLSCVACAGSVGSTSQGLTHLSLTPVEVPMETRTREGG